MEDIRRPSVVTADRPARERSRVGPIDGLRGVALVAVLLYHVAPGTVRGGFLGVEAFFVLSGYLLTALLLDEHRRTGRVDRTSYGGRRVRRIYPALLALLAAWSSSFLCSTRPTPTGCRSTCSRRSAASPT